MIKLVEDEDEDDVRHLLDTGITCAYDGEPIEYMDLIIIFMMIRPYVVDNRVVFYDVVTEDQTDYLYEPAIFQGKNWDEVEEKFEIYARGKRAESNPNAIVHCRYCKSGILAGETTGVGLLGEIHRSQRNPNLEPDANTFERLSTEPIVICISCMLDLNVDHHEMWADGVCHDSECQEGTHARCWRDGCEGSCGRVKSGAEDW